MGIIHYYIFTTFPIRIRESGIFAHVNRRLSMKFLLFDYIVKFIILIVIHAPWWAWLIYVSCALIGFVIWAISDNELNEKSEEPQKTHQ